MSEDKTTEAPTPEEAKTGSEAKAAEDKASPLSNLLFVAAFLLTMVGGYFAGQWVIEYFRPVDFESGSRYRVDLRGDEPQKGPDEALVTIIEFSDFQCPYCAKAVGPLEEAMSSFDEGEVRVIFKHYPLNFHRLATPAARVAWAAHQQGKFWEFADLLFEHKANFEQLPQWCEQLGLDKDRLVADMESPKSLEMIDDDMLSGGKAGVSGTPAFMVNGYPYSGAIDAGSWKKIIKHELALAEKLVDDGVEPGKVYETLMADANETRGDGNPVGKKPSDRPENQKAGPNPGLTYKVTTDGRPQMGPDNALVTIVEFADFHCPYCARTAESMKALVSKYEGDVRVVFRQMPLPIHPGAAEAAYSSVAAGKQGKFWEAHDAHFGGKIRGEQQHRGLATDLGIDFDRYEADRNGAEVKAEVDADMALARKMGVTGTPAFFINGKFVNGARPLKEFESIVEEALEGARKRLGAGIPRAGVYDAIMAEAQDGI